MMHCVNNVARKISELLPAWPSVLAYASACMFFSHPCQIANEAITKSLLHTCFQSVYPAPNKEGIMISVEQYEV